MSLFRENMELATSMYIDCANNSLWQYSDPSLYSSSEQKERASLTVFLKGSKEKLKEKEPRVFEYFKMIWDIKNQA